jgi:hypothetical protein
MLKNAFNVWFVLAKITFKYFAKAKAGVIIVSVFDRKTTIKTKLF